MTFLPQILAIPGSLTALLDRDGELTTTITR